MRRELEGAAQKAMDFLTGLLDNDEVKEETRLKAAGMILDRAAPKTPARAEPAAAAPTTLRFEGALEKWSE